MDMYFIVHSVLLSSTGGAALTLAPGEWLVESDTETWETDEGETTPALVPGVPSADADFLPTGGTKTEIRCDVDPGFRPGDHVTLSLQRSI